MRLSIAPWIPLLLLALPVGALAFDPELEDEDAVTPAAAAPVPAAAASAKPFAEKGPRDLQTYLKDGVTPKYIRMDVKGYNVRTSPDFSVNRTDNVDFKSKGGDLFAVESIRKLQYGAAVRIHVEDELRWVYVPYERKNDFQFCESEACFTAMARSLDFLLKGSNVNAEQAQNCGVSSGPEGLILPAGAPAPRREPVTPLPPPRPAPAPVASTGLRTKPLWENARGAQGAQWTQMLSESIDKYGQGLLNQRNLSDARTFCPNFYRLNREEKKEFWVHLFNGIARYESNFKLGVPAFDEVLHVNVYRGQIRPSRYSMGLFQLSYSSAPGYRPGCRIDYNRDRGKDVSDPSLTIYDPKIQMDCAVTIMNRWVPRDGGVGLDSERGGARFWSTLRSSNPATQNVIATLKRHSACWK